MITNLRKLSLQLAGHIEKLCKRLNLQPVDKIKINLAKDIVKHMGLFPMGFEKKDLQLLLRMSHSQKPVPIEVTLLVELDERSIHVHIKAAEPDRKIADSTNGFVDPL